MNLVNLIKINEKNYEIYVNFLKSKIIQKYSKCSDEKKNNYFMAPISIIWNHFYNEQQTKRCYGILFEGQAKS